jgi:hypothetical protein
VAGGEAVTALRCREYMMRAKRDNPLNAQLRCQGCQRLHDGQLAADIHRQEFILEYGQVAWDTRLIDKAKELF